MGRVNADPRLYQGSVNEGSNTQTTDVNEAQVKAAMAGAMMEDAQHAGMLPGYPIGTSFIRFTGSDAPFTVLDRALAQKVNAKADSFDPDIDLAHWQNVLNDQLATTQFPTEPSQYPLYSQLANLVTFIYSRLDPDDSRKRAWVRSSETRGQHGRLDFQVLAYLFAKTAFDCPGWEIKKPTLWSIHRAVKLEVFLRHYDLILVALPQGPIKLVHILRPDAPAVVDQLDRPSLQDELVMYTRFFKQVRCPH